MLLSLGLIGCASEDDNEPLEREQVAGVVATECLTGVSCTAASDCGADEACNQALVAPECQRVHCGGLGSYCDGEYADLLCADGWVCNQSFLPPQCHPPGPEFSWCALHIHCEGALICGALERCCEAGTCEPVEGGGDLEATNSGDVVESAADDAGGSDGGAALVANTARVYMQNPKEDEDLTEVVIEGVTDPDGKLTSDHATVYNCLNQDGGEAFQFGQLCLRQQTVQPGADGSYLHITPSSDTDPDDPFAELMMYYHMSRAHEYFTGALGMLPRETPLLALVNLQIKVGIGYWYPFDNAAFIPQQTMAQFGLGGINEDAIVFGQGSTVDFAYDADVILHEYTHAMVGATRLTGTAIDAYGLDNAPGAMNEAHADFFAASIAEDPVIGAYALTAFMGMDLARDLSQFRACPDDLTGEIHADGEVYGSALWAIREAVGAGKADAIIFDALQGLTQLTNFGMAAEATILRAAEEGPEVEAKVRKAFEDRGLLGCLRVKNFKDFITNGLDILPLVVEGTQSTGQFAFYEFAPAFIQYKVDLPANTRGVKLTATVVQGGFSPFSQGSVSMALAWRKGEMVTYDYGDGFAQPLADGVVDFAKQGQVYIATLSGSCIGEGTHYFQMLNKGESQIQVRAITMDILSEDPGVNNTDCAQ